MRTAQFEVGDLTPDRKREFRNLLMGGLLPVIAYTLVEALYGVKAGLIAGVTLGIGELAYEYFVLKRVQGITIVTNVLVVALGSLALIEEDGALFKLQPALVIFLFAFLMIGSSALGKPMLVAMALKQRPDLPEHVQTSFAGLNVRLGFALIQIGALGIYAAYHWSTPAWAAYKAVGAPVLVVLYTILDVLIVRWINRRRSGMK